MATSALFDIDAEVGSEEDEDYDEETGQIKTKTTRPTNGGGGANVDDSSEEEEDDDEEAERQVGYAH